MMGLYVQIDLLITARLERKFITVVKQLKNGLQQMVPVAAPTGNV